MAKDYVYELDNTIHGWKDGLHVNSPSTLQVTVQPGVYMISQRFYEVKSATNITVTASNINNAIGGEIIWANPPADYDGNVLTQISLTPEPDHVRDVLMNATQGKRIGRSVALAKVTSSANAGTVTMSGTFAAGETVTVTVDGTAVVTTLTTPQAASLTAVAAAVADAINANATVSAKVVATANAAVVTITAKTVGAVSAYSLVAADTAGSGTATASGANLAGSVVTLAGIDNTVKWSKFLGLPYKKDN